MLALLKQTRTGFLIAMVGLLLLSVISPVVTLANASLVPGDDAVVAEATTLYSDYSSTSEVKAEVATGTSVTVQDGPYTAEDGTLWFQVEVWDLTGYIPATTLDNVELEAELAEASTTENQEEPEQEEEESASTLQWQEPIDYAVANDNVICRGATSTSANDIVTLATGQTVEITDAEEIWAEGISWTSVNCAGVGGFVATDFLAVNEPAVEGEPVAVEDAEVVPQETMVEDLPNADEIIEEETSNVEEILDEEVPDTDELVDEAITDTQETTEVDTAEVVTLPWLEPIATAITADSVICRSDASTAASEILTFGVGETVEVTGGEVWAEGISWTPVNCAGVGGFTATSFLAADVPEAPEASSELEAVTEETATEEAAVEETEVATEQTVAQDTAVEDLPNADEIIEEETSNVEEIVEEETSNIEEMVDEEISSADDLIDEVTDGTEVVTEVSTETASAEATVDETTETATEVATVDDLPNADEIIDEETSNVEEVIEEEVPDTDELIDEATEGTEGATEVTTVDETEAATETATEEATVEETATEEATSAKTATATDEATVEETEEDLTEEVSGLAVEETESTSPVDDSAILGTATVTGTNGSGLACRTAADSSSAIIGVMPEGLQVFVLSEPDANGWMSIVCNNEVGFADSRLLFSGGAASEFSAGGASRGQVSGTGGGGLNCRSSASINSSIIGYFPAGSAVDVRGPAQGDWVPVVCGGSNGWVHGEYLTSYSGPTTGSGSGSGNTGSTGTATVTGTNGDGLRCRSGAGTTSSIITVLAANSTVSLRDGSQGEWQAVICGGTNGFAHSAYLTIGGSGDGGSDDGGTDGGNNGGGAVTGTATVVNTGGAGLRCRTGAGTGTSVVTVLGEGSTVSLRGNAEGSWQPVVCGGMNGYVHTDYISTSGGGAAAPAPQQPDPTPEPVAPSGMGNGDHAETTANLNMRYQASLGAGIATTAPAGTVVLITGPATNGFYPVNWDGLKGFMSSDYLTETNKDLSKRGGSASPSPSSPAPSDGGGSTATGNAIVDYAMGYVGYPYVWATHGPYSFDCSGFTSWVIKNVVGKEIGYGLWTQVSAGAPVSKSNLMPGDLVFFQNTYKSGLSHVGIYIGGGQFVHAQNEATGVVVSDLNSNYYGSRWYGGVRIN